jgi:hypothetical protein
MYEENYETPPSKSEFQSKLLEPWASLNRNLNHSVALTGQLNDAGAVSLKVLRQDWNIQCLLCATGQQDSCLFAMRDGTCFLP